MRYILASLIALTLALVIVACGEQKPPSQLPDGKADMCGYTWTKAFPASTSMNFTYEPDWRKFPKGCDYIGIRGCAKRTDGHTEIFLREPLEDALKEKGACNVVYHEIEHALGRVHAEKHSYTPTDYTNRLHKEINMEWIVILLALLALIALIAFVVLWPESKPDDKVRKKGDGGENPEEPPKKP